MRLGGAGRVGVWGLLPALQQGGQGQEHDEQLGSWTTLEANKNCLQLRHGSIVKC